MSLFLYLAPCREELTVYVALIQLAFLEVYPTILCRTGTFLCNPSEACFTSGMHKLLALLLDPILWTVVSFST